MSGDTVRATRDSALADALERVRAIERPGHWYDAVVEAPWTNVGDPWHPAQYSKGRYRLRFRGAVFGGTTEPIFYLPTEWWPEHDEPYAISRGDWVTAVILVSSSDGSVRRVS